MTVNIGLITSDALVFGCDSVASISQPYLDPFSVAVERDEDGNLAMDTDGRLSIKFGYNDLTQVVTSAWGGVTKMFQIHPDPSPVVAVTAGLAKLQDRSIASHAGEFFRRNRDPDRSNALVNVEPICRRFLQFMRRRYVEHYKGSPLPDSLKDGPNFLVGGIGRDDPFPSLYRVSVQENRMDCDFSDGECGVSWGGQADVVERFIRGYDFSLRAHVELAVTKALQAYGDRIHEYVTEVINGILDDLGEELPAGTKIAPPKPEKLQFGWEHFSVPIDYPNLPIQEAVNFASAMVMSQASRDRFATGVATVGGRTHIGVVTKSRGFEALNEPELVHRFTGLSDDV